VAIEILSTLVLFRNFAEWGGYSFPNGKIIGAFACIYVVNFWLTTRSSFQIYSGRLFFLDLLSLFILANLPTAIQATHPLWGYNPLFWFGLSVVELLNLDWNTVLRRESPTRSAKSHYRHWLLLTALAALMGMSVFVYQLLGSTFIVGVTAAWATMLFHIWMILRWNWDRYQLVKQHGQNFLDGQ
jgi:hypothetical protein